MDPTHDPNFTPPSLNPDIEPTAPSSKIPKNAPIQPLVLADMGDPVDDPPPHPSITGNKSTNSLPGLAHSKIPRKHTELIDSGSSSEKEKEVENDENEVIDDIEDTKSIKSTNSNHETINHISRRGSAALGRSNYSSHIGRSTSGPILPPTVAIQSHQIADLEEVPHGIQRQAKDLKHYQFPTHRLATTLHDNTKYPLVIVACGSFSPVTYLHLRMFEMALDAINEQTRFEVIGGYYSPVSSNYKKQGLAPAHHRVRMCELACERTLSWLMVDAWESLQPKYTRTALVLDHFNEEINIKRGGIRNENGEKRGVKIMLLAGGDLIESMGEPDVWADQDLHHILGKYGCLIVERTGADVRSFLLSHDIMYEHRRNVLVIKQLIYNDISSTKIRLFIRRGMSVQYLLPNSVIRYIQEHKLYVNETEPVKQVMSDKVE